jgi:phosphate transport system protein
MSLSTVPTADDQDEVAHLVGLAMKACESAQSAVSYAIDGLVNGANSSLENVRKCEERLDELDRELDERLAPVITQVSPEQARELLASMKLMIDLERIGDLVASFAERAAIMKHRLDMEDVSQLTKMGCLLENMIAQTTRAFSGRNVDLALSAIRADSELDRLRNMLLVRHTESDEGLRGQQSLHVLFMANALERAGDHAKNIAEETCHLVTGHTVRHLMRTSKEKSTEQLFLDWLAKHQTESTGISER